MAFQSFSRDGARYHLLRTRRFVAGSISLIIGLLIMLVPHAESRPMIRQEVIIPDTVTGAVMNPNEITRAPDGGYLIAGRINPSQQAWATKIDASGHVLWRYQIAPKEKLPIGQGAEFNSVAAMSDGTAFFCGNMPRSPGGYAPALLVHLDAQGEAISEQFLKPRTQSERGLAYFYKCAPWGDGVAIIGSVAEFDATEKKPTDYWLLVLDSSGKLLWEKRIPIFSERIGTIGPLFISDNLSLTFSSYIDGKTEIIRVDADGKIESKRIFDGQFKITLPVVKDNNLKLFGYTFSTPFQKSKTVSVMLSLNENLDEIDRVENKYPVDFFSRLEFRLKDGSLLLIGSAINERGEQYTPEVVSLDPQLRLRKAFDFKDGEFSDRSYTIAFVKAAAPTGNEGEFVTARSALNRMDRDDAHRGAVLDFIQIH